MLYGAAGALTICSGATILPISDAQDPASHRNEAYCDVSALSLDIIGNRL